MSVEVILSGLRCSACGAVGVLVLDVVRGVAGCRACGQRATVFGPEEFDEEGEDDAECHGGSETGWDLDSDGWGSA
ncbi:hypothetical protein [Sinosporangium siamense]|uniref:Uncharacterized protein n=1 Tax=Sinosporangium siamense TaxID=1367973 RepID=A0A919RPL2_9ACTN|nr:hypothetical protein [Sinosporangium siamense]GII97581.1 hypothetical protein Ssi02_78120 [Sinosporangium siamense]